jgi:hypothetical protein
MAVHAINILLMWALWPQPAKEEHVVAERRFSFSRKGAAKLMPVIFAMLLGGSVQASLLRPDTALRNALAELDSLPSRKMPVSEQDATMGPHPLSGRRRKSAASGT